MTKCWFSADTVTKSAHRHADPASLTNRHIPPDRQRPKLATSSESHDLPKKQAERVLGDLMTPATKHLGNGDKIRLTGLGILQVRHRPARMGINPGTGDAIEIKASKKIAFRAAKELKEAV